MLSRYLRRKVHDLRQQPEAARLRAATLLTAGTGGLLAILWLAILLPLQVRLSTSDRAEAPPVAVSSPTETPNQLAVPQPSPLREDVAGIASSAAPTGGLPVASPDITPSPSVTPTVSEPVLPVQTAP